MKKSIVVIVLSLVSVMSFGQKIDYNLQKGHVAVGYDVVSYFDNDPTKGKSSLVYNYENAKFKFSSQSNLDKFKANPTKYIPQYAGWCAYAMAAKSKKVEINPTTFEIRNGKLYLFYNKYFNNTFESWLEEMPDELVKKGNTNWSKIKFVN
jgi:YHS domain-containing protein